MSKLRCIVVGAKGFIGSALAAEALSRSYQLIAVDFDNYETMRGARADLLVNAAGNSKKYLDAQDPVIGFAQSVYAVMNIVHDFKYDAYIHLSSGAVYANEGDPGCNAESAPLQPSSMTPYGFHKWMAEQLVAYHVKNALILRLGGFVGPRLTKNAVYDILKGNRLFVHPQSEFQFMDTRDFARLVFSLYESKTMEISPLNIAAQGVISVAQMAEWAGFQMQPDYMSLPMVRAELNTTRAAEILPLPSTADTIRKFLRDFQTGEIILS